MESPDAADTVLGTHPIDHRPGLVWNAAFTMIKLWFRHRRPGRKPRQNLLDLFTETYAGSEYEPLPLVTLSTYIDVAFDAENQMHRLRGIGMQRLGAAAMLIPAPIAAHYQWRPGEREATIVSMTLFDHTYGHPGNEAERQP